MECRYLAAVTCSIITNFIEKLREESKSDKNENRKNEQNNANQEEKRKSTEEKAYPVPDALPAIENQIEGE